MLFIVESTVLPAKPVIQSDRRIYHSSNLGYFFLAVSKKNIIQTLKQRFLGNYGFYLEFKVKPFKPLNWYRINDSSSYNVMNAKPCSMRRDLNCLIPNWLRKHHLACEKLSPILWRHAVRSIIPLLKDSVSQFWMHVQSGRRNLNSNPSRTGWWKKAL
jgi:hypothetical protein